MGHIRYSLSRALTCSHTRADRRAGVGCALAFRAGVRVAGVAAGFLIGFLRRGAPVAMVARWAPARRQVARSVARAVERRASMSAITVSGGKPCHISTVGGVGVALADRGADRGADRLKAPEGLEGLEGLEGRELAGP